MKAPLEVEAASSVGPSAADEPRASGADSPALARILDGAPVGIHWVDADGIITWANRAELDMLGYAPEEYIGHPIARFHANPAVVTDLLGRLERGETLRGYEALLRHKDGSLRRVAIDSNAYRENGRFVHTRCFTRDFTERERLAHRVRDQLDELESLYRSAPIGLALIDGDFRFARVNERLAEINGVPVEQHLGRTPHEVVPDMASKAEAVFHRVLQTGEAVLDIELEGETPAQPGVRRSWKESWYPLRHATGEILGVSVVIEETTKRRRAETALAESARVTEALYQLTDRLHRARSLGDVYAAALEAILAALRCDRASILLFDEAGAMRFAGWRGLSEAYRAAVEGHSPWRPDEADPTPICIADLAEAGLDEALEAVVRREGISALAFIPLVAGGRLIGKFMTYYDAPHAFAEGEVALCLTIARQLAFGIERERAGAALRESERRFREMVDALPAAIYTTDADGHVTHFNPAAIDFFGRVPQLGSDRWCVSWRLFHADGTPMPPDRCPMANVLQGGQPASGLEAYAERPDGTCRWFVPYPTPLRDTHGRIVGGINMVVDITERKRAEEALRRSEERLRETDRRKDEFLAMLAHELRNPMAPIANAVQLLRSDRDPASQQQARDIIERQTARLARLVDDLLDVSRITTGRIKLKRELVAIEEIALRAAETVRPLVEQRGHQLSLSLPPEPLWLHGDSARLEQALVNLLNNAAKYTEDGGRIDLSARREDGEVVLRVRDTGVGIDPELLPHVFDLFTQAEHSLARSHGGLGIGLALVQRLVAVHGGNVGVQSTVGRGSEFTLRLPLAPSPAAETRRPRGSSGRATQCPLRALVVDDNVDAAESLAMLLELGGHEVRTAHDGAAALEAATRDRPHVVFLDIGLPKLDGYTVARHLRGEAALAGTRLVALTGYGQAADRARARDAGFDHHLVKPVDFARVEQIVAEVADSLPH